MRKLLVLSLLGCLALGGSGCIAVATPAVGTIYSDVKWAGIPTGEGGASKTGKSTATAYLSLFATGDASIEAAKKNGGITKVSHVDYHTTNLLGIIGTLETTVYGD